MKSFILVLTICLTIMAMTSAAVLEPVQSIDVEPALHRMKREDCDYRSCDQLCRRLKFPGGVCVNDRCKCDNF